MIKKEKIIKQKKRNWILAYFLIIILIIVLLNLILVGISPEKEQVIQEKKSFVSEQGKVLVRMELPAVDAEGNGVATLLAIEASPGTGRTLVDIDSLLFWADTQHSIRIARLVANKFSDVDVNSVDLIYSVEANASLVGGESAGAALAIATIAAIEGKPVNPNIMITGTINHDGSIGPVSAILEKAKASKQAGAKVFLVPLLQNRDILYETEKHCEEFGLSEICTSETKPREINVTEEAEIEVVEVANIEEAMEYFFD